MKATWQGVSTGNPGSKTAAEPVSPPKHNRTRIVIQGVHINRAPDGRTVRRSGNPGWSLGLRWAFLVRVHFFFYETEAYERGRLEALLLGALAVQFQEAGEDLVAEVVGPAVTPRLLAAAAARADSSSSSSSS